MGVPTKVIRFAYHVTSCSLALLVGDGSIYGQRVQANRLQNASIICIDDDTRAVAGAVNAVSVLECVPRGLKTETVEWAGVGAEC